MLITIVDFPNFINFFESIEFFKINTEIFLIFFYYILSNFKNVTKEFKIVLDKTKEQMNTIIEKKEASTKDIDTKYSALIDSMEAQNKKIEELTKQISKIEK